jgi:PadR family transcriptional regulator PadR
MFMWILMRPRQAFTLTELKRRLGSMPGIERRTLHYKIAMQPPQADGDKWVAQMRRGSLELCVLAILQRGQRYGYDIVQALAGGEGLVMKEGTIYPLLNRLMSEGLVDARWQPSPEGPARKYYTLTNAGVARLETMRDEWRRFAADVARLLDNAP